MMSLVDGLGALEEMAEPGDGKRAIPDPQRCVGPLDLCPDPAQLGRTDGRPAIELARARHLLALYTHFGTRFVEAPLRAGARPLGHDGRAERDARHDGKHERTAW